MTDLAADVARVLEADRELAEAGPTPFPLPVGDLAPVVAGAVAGLGAGDWWCPGLRERVGAVLRGVPVRRIVDGLQGARPYKVAPPSPSPALRALHAVGLALAGDGATVLVHLGVGSLSDGALAEALNLAALHAAPVLFLVTERDLTGAPVPVQSAAGALALAEAHGVPTVSVEPTAEAVRDAVAQAREAGGPTLLSVRMD